MRRVLLLILVLLLPTAVLAESLALPKAQSIEEAEAFVLYPPEEGVAEVQRGFIRYIAQHRGNDPEMFRKQYWLGGPEGSALDLTAQTGRNGVPYLYHAGNMCTRAAFSMAMSYLGIDVTPGAISATTGQRDMDPPYKEISDLYGLELVQPKAHIFDTMMDNYLSDPRYSPVYVYLRMPDGGNHAVLVIAALPQKSQFVILDPSAMLLQGQPHRAYMVAFNRLRTRIENSTFRQALRGCEIIGLYQWCLPAD